MSDDKLGGLDQERRLGSYTYTMIQTLRGSIGRLQRLSRGHSLGVKISLSLPRLLEELAFSHNLIERCEHSGYRFIQLLIIKFIRPQIFLVQLQVFFIRILFFWVMYDDFSY
jgi:hypothetical protein